MKYKTLLKFLFVFLIFSACEVKWDMEISFEEDLSGSYSIAVLIDQEAQMYAVETGQSSIGGLDAILSNLPDGFGSSVYQEGNYLGILIRNDFEDTDELLLQFEQLKSDENTALLSELTFNLVSAIPSDIRIRNIVAYISKKVVFSTNPGSSKS